MALDNGQKSVFADSYDVAVRQTFDLLHIKCRNFLIFIPFDICVEFIHD